MARRAWLFPIVGLLAAAMFLIFHKDESAPRKLPEQTRPISKRPSTGDDSAVALAPVGSDSRKPTEHERAGMRGSVSGTVLYTDGAPAAGLSVSIDAALQARTDPDGRFRFDDLKPGAYLVFVEEDELWGFHLLPGEQRTLDFRIPHSALVSGVITAADTLEPLDEVFATVQGSDGRTLRVAMTNKDGRFECRVPEGRHSLLVHAAAYQMQQLPCVVGTAGVEMHIRLARARHLSIRFENLPEAWRGTLHRFSLRFHDRSGRLSRLGWETPLLLTKDGRLKHPLPEPPPGAYELRLEDVSWSWRIPFLLSQELFVPGGPGPPTEQTIRLPDGAPVTLVLNDPHGAFDGLVRIGPMPLFANPAASLHFQYVPEGQHAIWLMRPGHEIRVGELKVKAGRAIRHQLSLTGNATLRGRPDPYGESPVDLLRVDGEVVARGAHESSDFAFVGLQPGSYVLVIGERRIPVQLTAGQDLDLGVLR